VPAGRGRVVRELLEAIAKLPHEHRFLLYCRTPADGLALDERFEWRRVGAPDPLWHLLTALRANRECGAFFSTNSYLTAWFTRVPTAIEIYDLIPFQPGAQAQRRAALIERATIRPALRRARSLICISEATRDDLIRHFPIADGKARVAQLAAGERFNASRPPEDLAAVTRRLGLDGPFVLCTGTLEPRKNLRRLIEAFVGLPDDLRGTLALVGPKGWENEEFEQLTRSHAADVKLLGYVSDDDLAALYQACTVFSYPSLYEGFGLPVLEAMACGAPVLTSRVSSMPEIAGEAARYVNPLDAGDIRAGLTELLESADLRESLSAAGREQAAKFSWERTARETIEALEALA
jgi:glycosyltransferase involved in cell wall biosynthesis